LIATLLLPLYYLTDATVTLCRRIARREPFWAAHRTHFYQRATDNGFTVRACRRSLRAHIVLAVLAVISIRAGSATEGVAAGLVGALPSPCSSGGFPQPAL